MKLAICDVCKKQEEFQDECPLKTQEICKDCINSKSTNMVPSPSFKFTKDNLKSTQDGLLIGNTDNIIMNYKTNDMMIIEYKSGPAKPYIEKYGQWSIYKELDRSMQTRGASYRGVYVIWTDKYQLDESKEYKINGFKVTKDILVRFMNMDTDAYVPIDFSNFEEYKKIMNKK